MNTLLVLLQPTHYHDILPRIFTPGIQPKHSRDVESAQVESQCLLLQFSAAGSTTAAVAAAAAAAAAAVSALAHAEGRTRRSLALPPPCCPCPCPSGKAMPAYFAPRQTRANSDRLQTAFAEQAYCYSRHTCCMPSTPSSQTRRILRQHQRTRISRRPATNRRHSHCRRHRHRHRKKKNW